MVFRKKSHRMVLLAAGAVLMIGLYFGWKFTARSSYEAADYTVIEQEEAFEIRDYPDLVLATTASRTPGQGGEGSFRQLFRFISGENTQEQKISMTVPVFMQADSTESDGQMSFVLPQKIAPSEVPAPTNRAVRITRRESGRFAVIRFSGRMSKSILEKQEAQLRQWIEFKGLESDATAEFAGYDPPWTPGPLRRNEVLIRLD